MAFHTEVAARDVVASSSSRATPGATTPGWTARPTSRPIARADDDLRGAPRLVAKAPRRRAAPAELRRAGRRAGPLPHRPRLHPRRVPAGDGAPLRRLVGLPGDVLLRARPRGSATPTASAAWSTGCTRPASASSSTGCRRTSPRTSSRWPGSTARRSTRTPTPRAASTPTGAPTSSTSAAARCATSWSPTRSTGSRSSTSTGCGSTPSPRCSTSTTPASPASGRPNVHGGRENLEAVQFLQEMNATVDKRVPGAVTIAEESTSWPGVTRPTSDDGPRLRLQVEHGLDARLARLPAARAGAPRLPPRRADVLDRLRLVGELRAPDQPRRGRARQGLAAAQDARRPLAAARQPARLPRLHVGPPGQAAALHGLRVRPGVGVGRGPRARLVAARPPRAPRRAVPGARPQPGLPPRPRRCGPTTTTPRASAGSTPTTPARNVFSFVRARQPTASRRSVCVANFAAHAPRRLPAGAALRPAPGRRSSTPTPRPTPAPASATSARSRRAPTRTAGRTRSWCSRPGDRLVPASA